MTTPNPPQHFVNLLIGEQTRLLAYILSLLPDYEAARNVLQETNIILWSKSEEFEEGTNFFAWACQIARLKVLSHFRAQGRERMVFGDQLLQHIAETAQRHNEATDELSRYLDECLALRNEEERQLLRDRYGADGSVKKLARQRGETANRLSVRLSRLRLALLECVRRKLAFAELSATRKETT